MSTITVLINGRRPIIKVLPDMTILEILEVVCKKFDLSPQEYDLKHHKRILDLTSMFRFSGLPNNCQLEMVEATKIRSDAEVILGLQMEDGTRVQGSFKSTDNLMDVLQILSPEKCDLKLNPVIIYMRKEVYGASLGTTSLKSLGLTGGRAILRLVQRKPEELKTQANVSAALPQRQIQNRDECKINSAVSSCLLKTLKQEKDSKAVLASKNDAQLMNVDTLNGHILRDHSISPEIETKKAKIEIEPQPELNIFEPEIIELGERNAILFSLESVQMQQAIIDLPDSFFDLTVNDVKNLLRDLKNTTTEIDDAPLLTSKMRELQESSKVLNYLGQYKTTVIRIQFPDRLVLQGTFSPVETVGNVMDFVRNYLKDPKIDFHLFTTPPKEILNCYSSHLVEVKCVPQALLHFGGNLSFETVNFLKDELSSKLSSANAATMSASKSRGFLAKSNKKINMTNDDQLQGTSGIQRNLGAIPKQKSDHFSKSSAVKDISTPKWFKPTGK